MNEGTFITFEGPDASGKTTLTHEMKRIFEQAGRTVTLVGHSEFVRTGFDTTTFLGRKLQALDPILWGGHRTYDPIKEVPPECWIYLLATWYTLLSHHLINPLRQSGHIVIADSWVYKQIVYHNLAATIEESYVLRHFEQVAKPEITFFLRVRPEITWQRRDDHLPRDYGYYDGSTTLSRESYLNHQQRMASRFESYARQNKWVVLDAEKTPNDLAEEMLTLHLRRPW